MDIGKVYTFKLNSGEELIGKVVESRTHIIEVENPVSVAPGPQGLGLVPSVFTAGSKNSVSLNMNCVALHALTDDAVTAKYIEATTGIKVPDKKLILG